MTTTEIDVQVNLADTEIDVQVSPEEIEAAVQLSPPTFMVISVLPTGPRGPVGPEGPEGPAGPGLTSFYMHDQGIPASTWTIAHNLGFRPNVAVFDSAGTPAEGTVAHIDDNNLTISFTSSGNPASFGGVAYLS